MTNILEPVRDINNLEIRRRKNHERGVKPYVVFSPDGRALEEFSRLKSAERWCRDTLDFATPGLSAEQRAQLAAEVFDVAIKSFEVFGEQNVGADLAYLMGAIVDEPENASFVDWSPDVINREVAILKPLRAHFPPEHSFWKFVVLDAE
jgi:hypothetical protein